MGLFETNFDWAASKNDQVINIIKKCSDIIVDINIADLEKDMKNATEYEITIPGASIGCIHSKFNHNIPPENSRYLSKLLYRHLSTPINFRGQ